MSALCAVRGRVQRYADYAPTEFLGDRRIRNPPCGTRRV